MSDINFREKYVWTKNMTDEEIKKLMIFIVSIVLIPANLKEFIDDFQTSTNMINRH